MRGLGAEAAREEAGRSPWDGKRKLRQRKEKTWLAHGVEAKEESPGGRSCFKNVVERSREQGARKEQWAGLRRGHC